MEYLLYTIFLNYEKSQHIERMPFCVRPVAARLTLLSKMGKTHNYLYNETV